MAKTNKDGLIAVHQPNDFKLHKAAVKLGNAFVRRGARDRRKVMRALEQYVLQKTNSGLYRPHWSKEDMQDCYIELRRISPKMAKGFRHWASMLLKAGHNNYLAAKSLMDELEVRTWIEDPKSEFYR